MPGEDVICSGMVERIGLKNSIIHFKSDNNKIDDIQNIPNHEVGLEKISELILNKDIGVLADPNDIHAVAHRVVHGGSTFSKTTVIDRNVK